jgi:hypothetical protein
MEPVLEADSATKYARIQAWVRLRFTPPITDQP